MQPASLAKMMTFYLALEAVRQKRITLDWSGTGLKLIVDAGIRRISFRAAGNAGCLALAKSLTKDNLGLLGSVPALIGSPRSESPKLSS